MRNGEHPLKAGCVYCKLGLKICGYVYKMEHPTVRPTDHYSFYQGGTEGKGIAAARNVINNQHSNSLTTIKFIEKEGEELDIIRNLFREYASELNEDLCFQSFEAELKNPLKKYVEPGGLILLACANNEPIGCIALMPLDSSTCEMKRLYIKPAYRKSGLGRELVSQLLLLAKQKGFEKMKLDTLQRLQPAVRLYENFGFNHTTAYYANPIAGVVYMEKLL